MRIALLESIKIRLAEYLKGEENEMITNFDSTKVNPDLPGIITLSHGPLAKAVLESAAVILGMEIENSAAFCLEPDDNPMEYGKFVMESLEAFPKGCLICLDILGGSPFNQILLNYRKKESPPYAVTAVSLPMVISASTYRDAGLEPDELLETVIQESRDAVVNVKDMMEEIRR
jgi:mannose/fructose-specific phosphotransferase system component IIA